MDHAGEKRQQRQHGFEPGGFPRPTLLHHRRQHFHQRRLRCHGDPSPQEGDVEGSGRGREAPPQDLPSIRFSDPVFRIRVRPLLLVPDVVVLNLRQGPPFRLLVRSLLVPVLKNERVPQPPHVLHGKREVAEGDVEGVGGVEKEKVRPRKFLVN